MYLKIIRSQIFIKNLNKDLLVRNSFFITMGSLIGTVTGFIFWIIAARSYTASDIGLASTVISLFGLITMFSTLGLHTGLIRYLPVAAHKNDLLNLCFTFVGFSTLIISIVAFVGLKYFFPQVIFIQGNLYVVLLFITISILNSALILQRSFFIGFRKAEYVSIMQITSGVIKIFPLFLLSAIGSLGIIISWGISSFIIFIIMLFFIISILDDYAPLPNFDKKLLGEMSRFSFVSYISECVGNLPVYLIPMILLTCLGSKETAYYYISWTIVSGFSIVTGSIIQALFAEGSSEPEKLTLNLMKSSKIIGILSIFFLAFVFLFGKEILNIFGPEYSGQSLKLLWVLSFAVISQTINEFLSTIFLIKMQLKNILFLNFLRTMLVIMMIYVLVTRFGVLGIGMGYILAYSIVSLIAAKALMQNNIEKIRFWR